MSADTEVFLTDWFDGCSGQIEIRHKGMGPMRSHFLKSPEAAADYVAHILGENADQDVYVGVATRREVDGKVKGSKQYVSELPGLWLDLDPKEDVDTGERTREITASDPTMVVDSGRGRHFYWKFDQPLTHESDQVWVEDACRGLAEKYGGDVAVCDVARIMRVPGTVNQKEGAGRASILGGSQVRHARSSFVRMAALGKRNRPHSGDSEDNLHTRHYTEGDRNQGMKLFLARLMYSGVVGAGEALAAGRAWNLAHCDPPLADHEVESFRPFLERGDWRDETTLLESERVEVARNVLTEGQASSVSFLSQVQRDCAPPEMIIPKLLPEGATVILAAPGGAGKGWFIVQLMTRIACGVPWGPLLVGQPRPCLFVDYEDGLEMLSWRTSQVAREMFPDGMPDWAEGLLGRNARQMSIGGSALRWHEGLGEQILVEIEAMGGDRPGVVWVDTLAKSLPEGTENNDPVAVSAVMDELTGLTASTGWTVGLSGHVPKAGLKKGNIDTLSVMGSAGWVNSARVTWLAVPLNRERVAKEFPRLKGQRVIQMRVDKANWFAGGPDLFLKQNGEVPQDVAGTLDWVDDEDRLTGDEAADNALKVWVGDMRRDVSLTELHSALERILGDLGMAKNEKARKDVIASAMQAGWLARSREGQRGTMLYGLARPGFGDSESDAISDSSLDSSGGL